PAPGLLAVHGHAAGRAAAERGVEDRPAGLGAVMLSVDFYRDRSVLCTGATGLLGSWLCRALVQAGANVVALVRDEVPHSNLHRLGLSTQVTQVRGQLEDLGLLTRIIAEY